MKQIGHFVCFCPQISTLLNYLYCLCSDIYSQYSVDVQISVVSLFRYLYCLCSTIDIVSVQISKYCLCSNIYIVSVQLSMLSLFNYRYCLCSDINIVSVQNLFAIGLDTLLIIGDVLKRKTLMKLYLLFSVSIANRPGLYI